MRRGSLFFTIFLMSLVLLGSCSKNSDNNKENDAKETMKKYIVEVDPVLHGSISIEPDISSGESYDAGTEIVITAKPREGYCLDSIYYAVQGKYG
ncbi:MAG: hypothetical protein PQJ46_09525, partial [Spirochaetales bacterium]|nr:hypothetical protein [Spirochaetales bacterium]